MTLALDNCELASDLPVLLNVKNIEATGIISRRVATSPNLYTFQLAKFGLLVLPGVHQEADG